jgi:hypothetical protein
MTNYDTAQIRSAILEGRLDSYLDTLTSLIRTRKEMQTLARKSCLSVGDTIKISETASPKYIRGQKATIVKINRERVVINFDQKHGRFHRNVTCPVSIIAQ